MIDFERLRSAYRTARAALLDERTPAGHWVGELSSSALSTATAVSALAIAARHTEPADRRRYAALIDAGLQWIFDRQNHDGGWGDTDRSLSNISTTMLVQAAAHLASRERERPEALQRAKVYVEAQGEIAGLRRRYGNDKTFAVPILTNCALAGLVPWSEVSPLPFELACLPQSWYRFARLPVVSYAVPALVAIGQARYFHKKPWNPLTRVVRAASVERSLKVLQQMQPASGGFLEAVPLTSFVVMSLAAIGRHGHPVTRLGLKFLVDSVRPDGSWPIDTNLATWVTTLAVNALGPEAEEERYLTDALLAWVLKCQHRKRHPFTGAEPGGWGWTDLSGAVPDADDTPGAMLAIHVCREASVDEPTCDPTRIEGAVADIDAGAEWLRRLQNYDGGWPTFCRGWGKLPFDRSGTDLTAHVLRALHRSYDAGGLPSRWKRGLSAGLRFLARRQRRDGSWLPLWFGNQHRPDDENPLYGTAKVLLAYRDLGRMHDEPARRAVDYLLTQQNADGGWGGTGPASFGLGNSEFGTRTCEAETAADVSPPVVADRIPNSESRTTAPTVSAYSIQGPHVSSVEETGVVVEALCAAASRPDVAATVARGVAWLIAAVETGRFRQPSPIGFYFAKLWYYERLYPLIFTVGALRGVVERIGESPGADASGSPG